MDEEYLVDYTESPFSKVIANENYVKDAVVVIQRKCETNFNTPISKKMKIELRTWKKFMTRRYIKLLTFHRLSSFCGLSENEMREGIMFIDGIEKPTPEKLPSLE